MRRVITQKDLDTGWMAQGQARTATRAARGAARGTRATAAAAGGDARAAPGGEPPPPPGGKGPDTYTDRLLKYIPSETIALFVTLDGILLTVDEPPLFVWWAVFVALLLITALYIGRVTWSPQGRVAWIQVAISTLAMAVWIFALGGPFTNYTWYEPYMGAILVPLFTVGAPLATGL
ncbi:MAG TPA: hypothetical protein VI796_02640 [Candidatus Thermoplasmatota archaeon]|nr:hypothetical protein [Candidatus Thermoplasmatota archaeon]